MESRSLVAESVDELLEKAVIATARPAKATIAIAVLRILMWRMFFMIFPLFGRPVWLRGVQEEGQKGTWHFFEDS